VRKLVKLTFAFGVAGLLAAPVGAMEMPGEEDGQRLMQAMEAVAQDDWVAADFAAGRVGDPVAVDLVTLMRLVEGEGDWPDYAAFLESHPDWPRRRSLRRQAEKTMPAGLPATVVNEFFAEDPPQTGNGALRLARALQEIGRTADARDTAIRAWRELSLTPSEQTALMAGYGGVLSRHHEERFDNLLWRGLSGEAEQMAPYVSAGHLALGKARIALRRKARGVDGLIAAVPKALQDDPGLAYERFIWRMKQDLYEPAEEMLKARTGSAKALGRPDRWADRRHTLARRAMRLGRHADAYRLASTHHLNGGSDFAELEWLSGWLALRKLNDPKQALVHFEQFAADAKTPISVGRAGYWTGRAREALGDEKGARAAYAEAALRQTSFYGQLAAERIKAPIDYTIAADDKVDWRSAPFMRGDLVRAAVLLHQADEGALAHQFFLHAAARLSNPRDYAALAQLALELEKPNTAVRVAKTAAQGGLVIPAPYYPVTELAYYGVDLEPALAMSVARQESELNPHAVSPAGALGLMQLMPRTAQKVAGGLGLRYDRARLTNDWRYNARLGQAYLAGLIEEFGSYPLAVAGYNAGPHRVLQWLESYGDPRTGEVDMIDWIETIPYAETRNYVQRVMEGLHVYRARINGAASPIQLTRDLGRRVR
jgi:soluble lytic murein transglycosylase